MAFVWDRSLSVGVREIDEQHQELFRRIEGLLDALRANRGKDETAKLLGFLERYVVEHFGAEARLMRARAYPQAAAHLLQHDRCTSCLAALRAELEARGPSLSLALKVNTQLGDWLRGHVRQTDRELAAFLRERQPGRLEGRYCASR